MPGQVTLLTIISFLLFIQPAFRKKDKAGHLFSIAVTNRVGYINSKGEIVVAPQFYNGSEFSEGLAAVRKEGVYGYINTNGNWVIPPQFDYALPFSEGAGIVYKDGRPFYIDASGKTLFTHDFAELNSFAHGFAKVKTLQG